MIPHVWADPSARIMPAINRMPNADDVRSINAIAEALHVQVMECEDVEEVRYYAFTLRRALKAAMREGRDPYELLYQAGIPESWVGWLLDVKTGYRAPRK